MSMTKAQVKALHNTYMKIDADLTKGETATDEIQKRMADALSSKAKQQVFCAFMQYQFGVDKTVNGRLQTCINRPNTQRYIFKVKKGEPLTKVMSIRTANKELLNKKDANGKAIATPKQVAQKGVYHCFNYAKPQVKKPTQIKKGQAWVSEFSITKEQYLAHAESGKIKFHVID